MRRLSCILVSFLMIACQGSKDVHPDIKLDSNTTQVMVLGTYHFVASESDIVSLDSKSVLNPRSQTELDAIASSISSFRPTHVIVERETNPPDYIDQKFTQYGPESLKKNTNERVQLGYRIAYTSNLDIVHGLDEHSQEDEPDYFPFEKLQKHAVQTGQQDDFEKLVSGFRSKAETAFASTEGQPIVNRLIDVNEGFLSSPSFYYELSQFDKGEDQPAAELQAYWFMRNAKIFSKLRNVTAPGDRVVIVYGAGHKFWLEHFVENTEGYSYIDPIPYLEAAR